MLAEQTEVTNPQMNLTEVGQIGTNILGFIDRQRTAIHTNGWVNLMDFHGFTATEVTTWIVTTERRKFACGRAQFG